MRGDVSKNSETAKEHVQQYPRSGGQFSEKKGYTKSHAGIQTDHVHPVYEHK